MADILFQLETIAAIARIVTPIKKVAIAMSTNQPAQSAVDKAATQNKLLFAVYMLLLLIVAFVSWLLWRSGNSLQDAIRDEARKDIASANAVAETAKKDAADANRGLGEANARIEEAKADAAKANRETEDLRKENLTLRTDLENATAESRAKQAELAREQAKLAVEQSKTARAQEEAAKAQQALAEKTEEIRKKQLPRRVQHDAFVAALKGTRKATAVILYPKNDEEAYGFAFFLMVELHETAGWNVRLAPIADSVDPFFSQLPSVIAVGGMHGVTILTKEIKPFPATGEVSPYAALVKALLASEVEVSAGVDLTLPDDSFRIVVGQKP